MAKLHFFTQGTKGPTEAATGDGDLPREVGKTFAVSVTSQKLEAGHDYKVTQGQGVPGTEACRCTTGAAKGGTANCTRTA